MLAGLAVLMAASPASAQTLTWSVTSSPSVGVKVNSLGGVSCVSATACMAVGSYSTGRYSSRTLIESWNGTSWSVVPSPSPKTSSYLDGVSCVSATACMAVGYYAVSGTTHHKTLAESWNGTSWSVVPSPSPGYYPRLDSVSCVTATACTAVGSDAANSAGIDYKTLIETWDGTSWTRVPSPSPGTNNYLYGVSCTSAATCTAVGYYAPNNSSGGMTLVESWNGTGWSKISSPSPVEDGQLDGVSCVSATACMAVGYYAVSGTTHHKTWAESWDGTSWSVTASPSPGYYSQLAGVSCAVAAACTAVGFHYTSSGRRTLIESWNGASWSTVPSRSRGTDSQLNAVVCASSTACTAAGSGTNSRGHYKTLIESGTATG